MRMPDVIGNLRVDQAWGYASFSVALHDASGGILGHRALGWFSCVTNNVNNGHPADTLGWGVSGGALFNIPGGHKLGINAQWSEGAAGYGAATGQSWSILSPGTSAGLGWAVDGVFTTGGEIELTRVWNVIAFYEHRWNPNWRTSWFGGYVQVDYNAAATNLINQRFIHGGAAVCGVARRPSTNLALRFTPLARQQLRPRLQLLSGRFPHPVEPGGAARYRPRSDVHEVQYRLRRSGPRCTCRLPQQPVLAIDDQDV